MQTSIATVCLSGGLVEKLEAIAAAEFRHVEIFENDLIAYPGKPTDIRRICADLGLSIVTCQPFRDFEGMPPERRGKTFDRAERKLDLLQELGSDLLFVCSSLAADSTGGIGRLSDDLAELAGRAGRRGMRVGYEALAWGRHVWDYRDAWEIVRRANDPHLGIILDSFHILTRGIDLSTIPAIPRERIVLVQVADAPRLQMDHLSWSRHWRCLPGQGDFDLASFMAALVAAGYDGALSLEIFNDRFRAGSARAVARDGHRSLLSLMDEAQRRCGQAVAGARSMPPPAPVFDVEFIEFAVEEDDRATFDTMLASLGFTHTGQHRSKDVALWRQGDVRLVVNADRDGFAHSYQITHGTSVCAIALRVPDAGKVIARAAALLDEPHRSSVGPGELDIPAVRGLGGSLVYFVDDQSGLHRWSDIDFQPTGNEPSQHGLLGVDHISQSMQYEEMLTWLLFYTSLLDASKTPSQAVIDPGGVVQSQVIESGLGNADARGLRLVLNGSQSHRTQSSRFVSGLFGSGVQHIALATSDLRQTIRMMQAKGVALLPIPENYYDDLETRSDLGADDLATLKSLNILYDRDEHGTFLHAYTVQLANGFFVEFVERRGYRGYGAGNAGIRLAAQARISESAAIP